MLLSKLNLGCVWRWGGLGVVVLVVGSLAGCRGREAGVVIWQPQVEGLEQSLNLASDWAMYRAGADGQPSRFLFAWPLPGSRQGKQRYLVYLIAPPGTSVYRIGEIIDGQRVAGMFIQNHGRARGVAPVVRGGFTVYETSTDRWRGQFDLVCADGTELRGAFVASPEGRDLEAFEQRYAEDVAALNSGRLLEAVQRMNTAEKPDHNTAVPFEPEQHHAL